MVEVDLPSAGRISFAKQPEQNRYCLHLLYAQPAHRGTVDVIEDIPPLYNIKVRLRIPEKVFRIEAFPSKESLVFCQEKNEVFLTVPQFKMHTVIVLTYEI